MTPETAAYWDRMLTGLVKALNPVDGKAVAMETARRMGNGGSSRQWTAMLLQVLTEHARDRGYTGSVAELVNLITWVDSAPSGDQLATKPTDPSDPNP